MKRKIKMLLSILEERIPGQEKAFFKNFLKIYLKDSANLEDYAKAFIKFEEKELNEKEIIEAINILLKEAEMQKFFELN